MSGHRRRERLHDGSRPSRRDGRWRTVLAIIIAAAVIALIVFLHLSGAIGPGIHQGG